jgi:hypothetical protein
MRPTIVAAMGLVAIALLTACHSDDSTAFRPYEEDGLAVEYPASWTFDEERRGGEAGIVVSAHGPRDEDGLYPRLSVARQDKEFVNAGQAGGVLATERAFGLRDGRLVSDRRTSVPGSDGAWRVETRYSIAHEDGAKVAGRAVEVIALKEDEQFILTLAGPAERIQRLPVERIVGSLDLR